jgi:hypothetical protein
MAKNDSARGQNCRLTKHTVSIRIPEELRANIPQLGEASEQEDPMLWLKLTCEPAGWTWYIIEMEPQGLDAIFYGYRVGWDEELTYFNQSDLELKSGSSSLSVEQVTGHQGIL